MKTAFGALFMCCLLLIAGCNTADVDTMVLLDEPISEVKISKSKGLGEINEDFIMTLRDKKSLDIVKKAITTAMIQPGEEIESEPDYDLVVEYRAEAGKLPLHGIHLWLGNDNEKSTLMYMIGDSVYLTTPQMTEKLRKLIPTDE